MADEATRKAEVHGMADEATRKAEVHGMADEATRKDENVVYIGKKSPMAYVLAVITQFNSGATEVAIKARGKVISRAVDVAEIVRNRFMPDAKLKGIVIKTEELTSEDGSMSKVSAIEITLAK